MGIIKFEDRKDRIVFFVGCFSTFYVSILGRVYVGELIIFLLYLFKSSIRGVQMPPYLKKINNDNLTGLSYLENELIKLGWTEA